MKSKKISNKLDFLLVMPRVVQTVGDGYQFPLGIAYVSSSMKAAGFNVSTINLNHIEGDIADILKKEISERNIDVICTGGLSFQYPTVRDIVEHTKKINPKVITVVGGGLVTAEPEIALAALKYADYGVIGEGEITMCELAAALENNQDINKVEGIIYKNNENFITTTSRKEIEDLDALPWPDYEGFDLDKCLDIPSSVNNLVAKRLIHVVGSRSCPYCCTFCFHSSGRKYRQRSIKSIMDEIFYLYEYYQIEFVSMSDELFARKKDRISEFTNQIKPLCIEWAGSFRVDDVDEDLIKVVKEGNCASMTFGLESADNGILKSMRKGITIEQIERALKMVYDANIPIGGNFIFGDIEETWETAQKTLDWWDKHSHYNLGLNLINTYPGTYIYKYACENNLIKDRVKFLRDGCPQVNISKLSESEMAVLAKQIFEKTYTTGKQVEDIQIKPSIVSGRITVKGKCCSCKEENKWEDVKLFIGNSWLPCKHCGQKHVIPVTEEIKMNVVENIKNILEKNEKIAIWGITHYSIMFLNTYKFFQDSRITFIDNSAAKQMMEFENQKIFSPSIVEEKNISTVVVFYPNSIQQISAQIKEFYPSVKKIIDVCDLINDVGVKV